MSVRIFGDGVGLTRLRKKTSRRISKWQRLWRTNLVCQTSLRYQGRKLKTSILESQLRRPKTLDAFCTIDDHERLIHSLVKSYADLAHAKQRDVKKFTDMVAKLRQVVFALLVKHDE